MPAVLIGSPASNNKVLRRADFSTERNGLETLNEIYTIRTADRATLFPDFGDLHKNYSTAATKFSRMSVENFASREQDGDLTEINVTYVGLTTSTGLPPAIVRLIPTPGAGVFGPPMVIEVEFLTDKTETQFLSTGAGGLSQPNNGKIFMPSQINGKTLPSNPREPFTISRLRFFQRYDGYVQNSLACERRGIFLVARVIFSESITTLI